MKLTLLACLLFTTLFYGQCPTGDVNFNTQLDVENFIATYPNCDTITGYLNITGSVNDLSALDTLLYIDGALFIHDTQLTSISNFNSLIEALVGIQITSNTMLMELTGFEGLNTTMQIYIENNSSLLTIDAFNNLPSVDGDLWINNNTSLQTINGFSNLTYVYYFLGRNNCPLLTSIPSFNNLNDIGWAIQFYNTGLKDISGFDNLASIGAFEPTSGFGVSNNLKLVSVSGFNCLENIVFDLLIQENPLLESISGLCSLESVGQFFTIRNNASLTTLNGLQSLVSLSSVGYESTVTLDIHDNPQLSDCDALCSLLSSNGIIGHTNITNNQTGCDSETEINTSNCTSFEVLDCTRLIEPVNGAVGVAIDTNISWNPVVDATSYLVSIGTTSEGTQIANNLNVGNITTYNLPNNLPENTEIYVKVKPYNAFGQAKCCTEERFTTANVTSLDCTNLISPLDNATDVLSTSNFTWITVTNATGYLISIGTTSGGTDVANSIDVGNVTTYNPGVLPQGVQVFVTITPYDASGEASGCVEESFITEPNAGCSNMVFPVFEALNVPVDTDISWTISTNTIGYTINIGTSIGGIDILSPTDVGNVTTFNPPFNLPPNTEIHITITSYNASGLGTVCDAGTFTTGDIATLGCATLNAPLNNEIEVLITSNLTWSAVNSATGYFITIGTTSGGTDIANNMDVGNFTIYNPLINFPENTELFVTVIPYNTLGQASSCQEESFTTERFTIENLSITIPKYFTPNNDGVHDVWKIEDPQHKIKALYIFDRFGKLLTTRANKELVWYGTFNNQLLPSNDYWYVIQFHSGKKIRGHFTLKR